MPGRQAARRAMYRNAGQTTPMEPCRSLDPFDRPKATTSPGPSQQSGAARRTEDAARIQQDSTSWRDAATITPISTPVSRETGSDLVDDDFQGR